MATLPVPPPPFNGPMTSPTFPVAAPGHCLFFLLNLNPATNKWGASPIEEANWDEWPLGYYTLPSSSPNLPTILVVYARTDPAGDVLPNVLDYPNWTVVNGSPSVTGVSTQPQPAPAPPPEPQCPPGFVLVPVSVLNPLSPPDFEWGFPGSGGPDWYGEICVPIGPAFTGQLWVEQQTTTTGGGSGSGSGGGGGGKKPPPKCPPGTVWDPSSETCKPIVTGQPCIPVITPYDDTLTSGLNCVSENLIVIQQLLQQMGQGGDGELIDPVTCTQLTGLVGQVNALLASIAKSVAAIAAGAGEPVTVNAPVTVNVPTQPPPTIEVNTTPPDLTAIVDQLMKLVTEGDVANSTFQWLQQQGYLTPEDLQLYEGLGWADSFFAMLRTLVSRVVTNFLAAFGFTITGGKPVYTGLEASWATGMKQSMAGFLAISDTTLAPVVAGLVNTIAGQLSGGGGGGIGVIGVDPDTVVANALSITFAAAAGAYLLAFVGIDEGEPLAHIAELVSAAIGFEEIRDVKIGPLIRQGVGLVAERQAKAKFQQELPGTTALLGYVAQGLMTSSRAQALSLLNGTSNEMFPIEAAAAYRGFNARQMLRLIETNLFSQAEIADELTFAAMRPVSQTRMLRAAPFLATASERSSLLAAVEAAAVAGLLADSDVTAQYDAAQSNEDPHSLILARLHLQQLTAATKDLETEYSTLFKGDLMTDQLYRANLAALGLQPWKVSSLAAKAEAAANVALQRKTLAAEAALEEGDRGQGAPGGDEKLHRRKYRRSSTRSSADRNRPNRDTGISMV